MPAESHYSITVSKKSRRAAAFNKTQYEYLFTADVVNAEMAQDAYDELKTAFPSPSYKVEVVNWNCTGHPMTDAFEAGRRKQS